MSSPYSYIQNTPEARPLTQHLHSIVIWHELLSSLSSDYFLGGRSEASLSDKVFIFLVLSEFPRHAVRVNMEEKLKRHFTKDWR